MPERNEYAPGTPNWVDCQTSDQAAAKQFYSGLFGWSYDDSPIDEANGVYYSMAQIGGKNVAALSPLGDMAAQGVPPHWNSYVSVSDVDATTALVEPAGGTVMMPPFDVMDAGRMSVVVDSTGAVINVWQAKNNIGANLVNEAGTFGWTELITPDPVKAGEFYNKVFGWEPNHNAMDGMEYTEFKLNGAPVCGGMKPPMPGMPPVWTVYFQTDDTDATAAKAQELGGTVMVPPTDIPPGRFAVIVDPQGAVFNVIKMNPM
jgi:predicted enzyme related to lactoylglutathione lyase